MVDHRTSIGLPERLTLSEQGGQVQISRRWFSWMTPVMSAFAFVWWLFLVGWYSNAAASIGVDAQLSASHVFQLLFPIVHVGVGCYVAYSAAAGWVNQTRITVDPVTVRVRNGPLPWPGNITIRSGELQQLYAKENVRERNNRTIVTYEVRAITKNNRNISMVSDLETQEQALFIEELIEKRLGIKNAPVRGAISGEDS